jgi:hypothetical protein
MLVMQEKGGHSAPSCGVPPLGSKILESGPVVMMPGTCHSQTAKRGFLVVLASVLCPACPFRRVPLHEDPRAPLTTPEAMAASTRLPPPPPAPPLVATAHPSQLRRLEGKDGTQSRLRDYIPALFSVRRLAFQLISASHRSATFYEGPSDARSGQALQT